MRRLVVAGPLSSALLAPIALPASAQPPSGSADTCPPSYDPITLQALLSQGQRLGIPEERARGLYAFVNKNGDGWICQKKLPGDDTNFNFVDNQAIGRDR